MGNEDHVHLFDDDVVRNEERKEMMLKFNQQTFKASKSLTHVLLGTRLYVGL